MANASRFSRSASLRWPISRKTIIETDKAMIGFLTFEISALMSRLIQLWNCLEDKEFTRVKEELSNSIGIRKLVSEDEHFLMNLFLKDIVDDLQYIAKSITIFGNRCSDSVIHEFVRFVNDPIKNDFEWYGWQYRWKKMERRMKKMERFVAITSELSQEIEVLTDVERSMSRIPVRFDFSRGKFLKYKQRVSRHRRYVENLKEMTPWKRSFDYVLRLFMRSIITIIERIKVLFGIKEMPVFEEMKKSTPESKSSSNQNQNHDQSSTKLTEIIRISHQFTNLKPFKACTDGGNGIEIEIDSPVLNRCRPIRSSSMNLNRQTSFSPDRINNNSDHSISSFFSKEISSSFSLPSTLGAASLEIHYAKMIIMIEKFATAPQLIDSKERDELFNMLPATMRRGLRSRMKSAAKISHSSIYNPVLTAEWKSAMTRILRWLVPLAQKMEEWHSERSFEKAYVVVSKSRSRSRSRSQALLIQTLHYANKEKAEDALMEVLVALNYICNAAAKDGERKRFSDDQKEVEIRRRYFCNKDEFNLDAL